MVPQTRPLISSRGLGLVKSVVTMPMPKQTTTPKKARMNLYWSLPARNASPSTSRIGTPWAKGVMISGTRIEMNSMIEPPIIVATAAVGVNLRQKTPSSSVTTSGGVTAAVNAPCAE